MTEDLLNELLEHDPASCPRPVSQQETTALPCNAASAIRTRHRPLPQRCFDIDHQWRQPIIDRTNQPLQAHSKADVMNPRASPAIIDSLTVQVITDNVSDTYVSKTPFAVSEFANIVLGGAKVISGETLLAANLGYGLRLRSRLGSTEHVLLFDTGTEG